jgi:hypothetical protein
VVRQRPSYALVPAARIIGWGRNLLTFHHIPCALLAIIVLNMDNII